MKKQISSAAIIALKDALSAIYWYKSDLKSFLQTSLINKEILNSINWDGAYKRDIVAILVDTLSIKQDIYCDDLLRLCYEVGNMIDFKHLERLEGGLEKGRQARIRVEHLNTLLNTHREFLDERQKIEENKKRAAEKLKTNHAVREKLKELKNQYMILVSSTDHAKRGFELEKIMYELFDLFDLDPKASFKNTGEQIDGAFYLAGTDFLFEAKWHNKPIGLAPLDSFSRKVARKLENTLGLFLSMSGYSSDAILVSSNDRPIIILMEGADLMALLEERIDFVTLLLRKKSHAARTGKVYFPIPEIL